MATLRNISSTMTRGMGDSGLEYCVIMLWEGGHLNFYLGGTSHPHIPLTRTCTLLPMGFPLSVALEEIQMMCVFKACELSQLPCETQGF